MEQLLAILDQAYGHRSWHGTNLRGSIRGVTALQAAWRPGPSRHNIWELVVHAAYWKYAARRRLMGESRGSFPLDGSNWFVRPEVDTTVRLPPPRSALRPAFAKASARPRRSKANAGRDTTYGLNADATDAWRSDIRLLDRMHRALCDAVARQSPRLLHRKIAGSKETRFSLITGVAAHDLYHAGQIQLLKRLGPGR